MWYVYILLCDGRFYYVGTTHNLEDQLKIHKESRSFFTKKYSEFELVYEELHPSKLSAEKREKELQKLNQQELKKLAERGR